MPQYIPPPEVQAAEAAEALVWESAFLVTRERIAGFEVLPLTLRHYVILKLARSPMLSASIPSPPQLAQFLWVISPRYSAAGGWRRFQFLRQCRRAMRTIQAAARIITDAQAYVAEALQDFPSAPGMMRSSANYYGEAAAFCAFFARHFGWTVERTMGMPTKQLFQLFKAQLRADNPRAALWRPSDRVAGAAIDTANKRN